MDIEEQAPPVEEQVLEPDDAAEADQQLLEEAAAAEAPEEVVNGAVEEEEQAAEEAAAVEDGAADEEEVDGVEVQEHLKDAVDGSLRLKRLLSRDQEKDGKKRKVEGAPDTRPVVQAKVKHLLARWALTHDQVARHVLDGLTSDELDEISAAGWAPDHNHINKSPCELLARYIGDVKERKMVGGQSVDCVSAFKYQWKLDAEAERKLRALPARELSHVLKNYDGIGSLDDSLEQAQNAEPCMDDLISIPAAISTAPGPTTVGRYNRLELIDPLADCAVFGDANLTFALKLAKHRKGLGHVGRVIATTFEEIETLRERYKEIDESIRILEEHYAEVYHGVDCTRIALDPRFEGMEGALGAVYYNFPHSGAIQGFFDGHPLVNWRHENLMRLFFRALRSFVKPDGLVKVSSNMGAVGVRYSYIVGGAAENEFHHVETVPFLEWHLHRYGRSYGDRRDIYKRPDEKNNQSYNAQAADRDMVYCFRYVPSGNNLPPQKLRLPPTLKTLCECKDGPFKHIQEAAKLALANELHSRFIKEVSGTHVG